MALGILSDRLRLMGFHGTEIMRGIIAQLRYMRIGLSPLAHLIPERLLIAPQSIATSDPTIAEDIYSGVFIFSGQVVETNGESVFNTASPSDSWLRALHGFSWLRHLRTAENAVAKANARTLVDEWIEMDGEFEPAAYEPEVIARRVLSWLSHSPLLLSGADREYYRRFMKTLARQVRRLRASGPLADDGLPLLQVAIAITSAGLCIAGQKALLRNGSKMLERELERQIFPDGGHISRNPAILIDLLLDLLPLRQAYVARNFTPPKILVQSLDRMMPMVRFFRHEDGGFVRFNGTGVTHNDLVATVLAYDDARGQPMRVANYSGYQRLLAGQTLIVCDCGKPPALSVSGMAHAGCLAFEMSVGQQPFIVNCGAPAENRFDLKRLARATAAHSTVTFNDTSSCRFVAEDSVIARHGQAVLSGPSVVTAIREDGEDGTQRMRASHNGYRTAFGIVHERKLEISADGCLIKGEDIFHIDGKGALKKDRDIFAIRFHLHPTVHSRLMDDGSSILLTSDIGAWIFTTSKMQVTIEESVFFAGFHGQRRTKQLVIHGSASQNEQVLWILERVPGNQKT